MASLLELPLWYEIRGNKCLVWEGVLALRYIEPVPESGSTSGTVIFAKLHRSTGSVHVVRAVLARDVELSSEGYWTCAEITGTLVTPNKDAMIEIYYHCPRPSEGYILLDTARRLAQASRPAIGRLEWEMVVVKVDPDPFLVRGGSRERRLVLSEWMGLGRSIQTRHCLVVERKAVQ